MQLYDPDVRRSKPTHEISRRSFDVARSFSQWLLKLLRNPLAIVLLVWGFLFLILSVTLAYAQEDRRIVNQSEIAIKPDREVRDQKTEVVKIFSAGADQVIPAPKTAIKSSSRRRKVAAERHGRR